MNRNQWIAVATGILVIAFFMYGDRLMGFFQGTSQSVPNSMSEQNPNTQALQIQDIQVGTGAEAVPGSLITVHYTGMLTDGRVFDSSVGREPFSLRLGTGQVIKGWDMGLQGMKVGGKRRLIIPPQLAYGDQQVGPIIGPNSTLVFDVELLGVQK